jgi:hypothetical protein
MPAERSETVASASFLGVDRIPSEPTDYERRLVARLGERDLCELNAADPSGQSEDFAFAPGDESLDLIEQTDLHDLRPAGVDPWLGVDGTALVAQVKAADRDESAAQARGLVALAELARTTWARERAESGVVDPDFMTALVATSLGLGPRVAAARIDDALALTERLPRTLAALAGGWLTMRAARTMAVETAQVGDDLVDTVEAAVFDDLGRGLFPATNPLGGFEPFDMRALSVLNPDLADDLATLGTPARMRQLCRRAVTTFDAAALRLREQRARSERDVRVWPGEPGTSWLGALLPDAEAAACYDRIDRSARNRLRHTDAAEGPVDSPQPTLAQTRANVLTDLLLGPEPDGTPGPPVRLTVQVGQPGDVRVDHLGATTEAALVDLIGFARRCGPAGRTDITTPATTSVSTREDRSIRLVTHKGVTCPGTHDAALPGPRFASPALAATVVTRDGTCRFPGCAVPAIDCDLDHVIPHPHGPTCVCNLICLCRRHHRVKTFAPGWRVVHLGDGVTTWITPSGRSITTDPDPPPPRPK